MKKLVLVIIVIVATFVWYGLQGESVKAKTGSVTSSDMPPTNFTGAVCRQKNVCQSRYFLRDTFGL